MEKVQLKDAKSDFHVVQHFERAPFLLAMKVPATITLAINTTINLIYFSSIEVKFHQLNN